MNRLPLFAAFALSLAIGSAFLRAQDVTVSAPTWFLSDPEPDQLPAPKRKLRVEYPDEMRKTSEIGVVLLRRYVDADGQSRVLQALGSHIPFQRAVEKAISDWSFSPAKSAGHAVDGAVWLAVIFNPKSADPDRPDATPRVLAVSPAITKRRPTPDDVPPVLPVHLKLDATGDIAELTLPDGVKKDARHAIEVALRSWRFAPARQHGQPIAAEITVPVVCMPPADPLGGRAVPPKVVRRETPEYPWEMRRFGLEGKVTVDFDVDAEGGVRNAYVSTTNNPAFDDNAVKSVRRWTFEPGTRNGRPIGTHMRVPIIFQLDEAPPSYFNGMSLGGGARATNDAFYITDRVNQSKLPAELRYDTPPKIRNVQIPIYPYALLRDRKTGTAKVDMLIDRTGHIAAVKVMSADQPEFGLALAAAVQGFVFDPALKDGKPVPHVLGFEQSFSRRDLPDADPDELMSNERKHPEKIVGARALDAKLKPLSVPPARFPVTVDPSVVSGNALIECLVDEQGRVRLPRIVSASDPAFGYAAVQAASAWWFEAPKSGGKAVIVRVEIPFKFEMKTGPGPAAKS